MLCNIIENANCLRLKRKEIMTLKAVLNDGICLLKKSVIFSMVLIEKV